MHIYMCMYIYDSNHLTHLIMMIVMTIMIFINDDEDHDNYYYQHLDKGVNALWMNSLISISKLFHIEYSMYD